MLVMFSNDFHNTCAGLRIKSWGNEISVMQVNRLERKLCGMRDCVCSGETGIRGPQPQTDGRYPYIVGSRYRYTVEPRTVESPSVRDSLELPRDHDLETMLVEHLESVRV